MEYQRVRRETNPDASNEGSEKNQPISNFPVSSNAKVIEIAYVIDATESMKIYINGVRGSLTEMVKSLSNELKEFELMFGICFYRDKMDKEEFEIVHLQSITTYLNDESSKKPEFLERLEKVECKGGDDTCEDVELGLKSALNEIKWNSPNKYIVLVADAPSHGKKFNGSFDDDYPEDDMTETVRNIYNQNIVFVGLDFRKETDVMFEEIKNLIDPQGNNDRFFKFSIKDDQKNTKNLASKIAYAVGGSIKSTMKTKKIDSVVGGASKNTMESKTNKINEGGTFSYTNLVCRDQDFKYIADNIVEYLNSREAPNDKLRITLKILRDLIEDDEAGVETVEKEFFALIEMHYGQLNEKFERSNQTFKPLIKLLQVIDLLVEKFQDYKPRQVIVDRIYKLLSEKKMLTSDWRFLRKLCQQRDDGKLETDIDLKNDLVNGFLKRIEKAKKHLLWKNETEGVKYAKETINFISKLSKEALFKFLLQGRFDKGRTESFSMIVGG